MNKKVKKFFEYFDTDELKSKHELELISGDMDLKHFVKDINKASTLYAKLDKDLTTKFPVLKNISSLFNDDIIERLCFIHDKHINTEKDDHINVHLDLRINILGDKYFVYSGNYVTINGEYVHDRELKIDDFITKKELYDFIEKTFFTDIYYIENKILKDYNLTIFSKPFKELVKTTSQEINN